MHSRTFTEKEPPRKSGRFRESAKWGFRENKNPSRLTLDAHIPLSDGPAQSPARCPFVRRVLRSPAPPTRLEPRDARRLPALLAPRGTSRRSPHLPLRGRHRPRGKKHTNALLRLRRHVLGGSRMGPGSARRGFSFSLFSGPLGSLTPNLPHSVPGTLPHQRGRRPTPADEPPPARPSRARVSLTLQATWGWRSSLFPLCRTAEASATA